MADIASIRQTKVPTNIGQSGKGQKQASCAGNGTSGHPGLASVKVGSKVNKGA